jgi:hypothetical protein
MRKDKILSVLDIFLDNKILTVLCVMFVIVDIVLLTCIIYSQLHQKEISKLRNNYIELMENRNELSEMIKVMEDNYSKIQERLNRMETVYKGVENQTQGNQAQENQTDEKQTQENQKQSRLDPKISSLTTDLHECQNANLNFISQMSEKEAVIASLKDQLRDHEEMAAGLKKLFAEKLALGPTWVKTGEAYTIPDGDFNIIVDEVSDKSPCVKDSIAVVSLMTGSDKEILCVGMDRPKSFKYKKKNYYLDLLGVRESEHSHEYLVSIVK